MHDMSQKVKKALHNASQDEWEKKKRHCTVLWLREILA